MAEAVLVGPAMHGITFSSCKTSLDPLFNKLRRIHWLLVLNLVLLVAWGVWVIHHASSFREGHRWSHAWLEQLRWALLGFGIFGGVAWFDYKWVRWGGVVACVVVVALSMFPELVSPVTLGDGAERFVILELPMVPMVTVAIVLILAVTLGYLHLVLPMLRHQWLRIAVVMGLVAFPMIGFWKIPDVGAVWGISLIGLFMLCLADIPGRYITVLAIAGIGLAPMRYSFGLDPHQKQWVNATVRILTAQKADAGGDVYVAERLKIAIGSAGITGKGPFSRHVDGHAIHRRYFSPTEATNYLIFAVIVEEFGMWGGLFLMVLMLLLLMQCLHVARAARDDFGRMLVVGVVTFLFVGSLQNMAMNLCMVPITKQSLPFVSHGGIHLVLCLFLMGLVQSVWSHREAGGSQPPPLPTAKSEENLPSPSQPEELPRLNG